MPLSSHNLDALTLLLTAISQRQDTVRQLVSSLQARNIWRSPDGTISVAFTAAQIEQLEKVVNDYLNESEAIIITARAMLGRPESLPGEPV
jgi:hypothetical protein